MIYGKATMCQTEQETPVKTERPAHETQGNETGMVMYSCTEESFKPFDMTLTWLGLKLSD